METKRIISMEDMVSLINGVVDSCFRESTDDKGETVIEYTPEYKDYALRLGVLLHYTDFEDASPDEIVEVIYGEQFENIKSVISQQQYLAILDAIDEKVKYRVGQFVTNSTESPVEKLINSLAGLLDSIKDNYSEFDIQQFADDIHSLGTTPTAEDFLNVLIKSKENSEGEVE